MSDQQKKIKQIETLRKVRVIRENQKKNNLAVTLKQQQTYLDQIKFLTDLKEEVYENIKQDQKGDIDLSQMMKYQMYLRQVHIKSIMANSTVKEIEVEINKRRQELIKANQSKVVSEKLLDKQKEILREERDKEELKTLDEVGSIVVRNKDNGELE
jgi:flagellar export protein FliJ